MIATTTCATEPARSDDCRISASSEIGTTGSTSGALGPGFPWSGGRGAALSWAIGQRHAERALAMAAALGRYWLMRNWYAKGADWIDRALSLPGAEPRSPGVRIVRQRDVDCPIERQRRVERNG